MAIHDDELSLGEYIRRLRREKRWNLQRLSEEAGLSYTHLSRIENDSTVPNADSVGRIAKALEGDLRLMLEKADCLPAEILERISGLDTVQMGRPLMRGVRGNEGQGDDDEFSALVHLAVQQGLPPDEAHQFASAVRDLLKLPAHQRGAVNSLIASLQAERDGTG